MKKCSWEIKPIQFIRRPTCKGLFYIIFFISFFTEKAKTQSYYAFVGNDLFTVDIDSLPCNCSFNLIADLLYWGDNLAFCPDGNLFMGVPNIYQVDLPSGTYEEIFTAPPGVLAQGLVCIGGGIFITMDLIGSGVYQTDVNTGIITFLGSTGYPLQGDITQYNGEMYYISVNNELIRLDPFNPPNSEIVAILNGNTNHLGLTASPFCNTLIVTYWVPFPQHPTMDLVNILDGTKTPFCTSPDYYEIEISTMLEHSVPAPCEVMFDLDCDGSYGLVTFNCLIEGGVVFVDQDINITTDDVLDQITLELISPAPDAPNEFLWMNGSIPGIDVTGSGTGMIILSNAGGATIQDFKDALLLIVYDNVSLPPTGGLRSIEVQFTSASGTMSPITYAYVEVEELPIIALELGPDQVRCDDETATFDAGNQATIFQWSTGENTQVITADESGQYSVTVSDGINCPNQDTAELMILSNISVALAGDAEICDNEPANLTILTNTPFPLTIEISADPGSPFLFTDVTGDFNFTDLPSQVTEYTITSVTSSQPACIEITNPTFVVEVFPSFILEQEVSLCDGDSIWLGFFWESDAGVYENLLQTEYGCDSFVTTYITILPAENIYINSSTCDSSSAGVFVTHLDNPNGCDTVVTTTVTLLPSDTTAINITSCNLTNTGVSILTLTNQAGCDSLIITTTSWIPPSDTTILNQATCDSSFIGVFQQIVPDQTGCDSLIITTVTMAPDDTTHLSTTSCDTSAIGVFELLLSNQMGCDSLIITMVSPGTPDTTLLFATSCDSSSLGVFETHFIASNNCDSTVITTISYSAQDSVFITSASCDPLDVGVFVTQHTNQFGCDSIVTESVSLLPSDATFLTSTACDPSVAGVFTQMLTNQFGCDSVVTETVSLLPSDAIFLTSTTCNSSEAGVFITTLANQYGCDSVITEAITLLPTDTILFAFQTCDPSQAGTVETLFTGQDGCDSLVIEATSLFPLPQLDVVAGSDFNGYDISCFGESDGSIAALVQGVPPYNYIWSTGDTDQSITGLAAGAYQVSVTDGNGCTTEGQIILVEPDAFEISFIVSQPDCFGVQEGSITVQPTGGVSPYRFSIDGTNYQISSDFTGLGEGVYLISSLDANDCITSEIIWINVLLMVEVELGDDQVISNGDSFLLQAIVNIPMDSLSSVTWTGIDSMDCPECLTQLVSPIITTAYTISVTTADGCADKDSLTLFVHQNDDIYIPNIFSPNGDNINDQLIITAGPDVEEIESFMIFDRWGNMVFLAEHVQADDPSASWDGTLNGERMNAAVFTYKLVARFEDGGRFVRYGDITLIK